MIGLEKDELLLEMSTTLEACTNYCRSYCKEHINRYTSIKYSNARWLTISPKSVDNVNPHDLSLFYIDKYVKELSKACTNMIMIVEFASERMHFHILLDVKDAVKYNVIVNTAMTYTQTRSYKGVPAGGIHYLFKDVHEALFILKSVDHIIYIKEDIAAMIYSDKQSNAVKRQELKRIKAEMKYSQQKQIEQAIPSWMLKRNHDSDSDE